LSIIHVDKFGPNFNLDKMFFSFDGIDGAGKSTQMRLFCDALRARGLDFLACRDPGSTPLGEKIREVLLTKDDSILISRRSEMLLYMAARAQLVDEMIQPALAAGKIVVSDRYLLANVVYQGHAGGLDVEMVRRVGEISTSGIYPDCVFLLDLAPVDADARMNRTLDRMEGRGADYRRRLRDGFLAEAARPDGRVRVINANRSVQEVQSDIWQIAEQMLAG
jgi:dTMP kinase